MDDAQVPDVPGYDVGRLLGRGGSADVWLAREQRTGRDVALKCFRKAGSRVRGGTAVTEEEMRREIRILSVLDHQHLVRAHDAVRVADSGSGKALTMDYAAGGSLAQLVAARGRLSVGETVTVLTPIAQALGYLHGKGFTHSDVSPGNVLFTGQGKPMLSDVGVARMLGDPGGAGTAGTLGFLDPSPIDAVRAGLQPERDVYSAAALGWFCLTGVAPGRTADRPPLSLLVPGVPKELAAVLEAGLNEDRRLRPDALALATAVYRSAEPQPVDLSDAVHPTVLPELLTRRHTAPETRGGGLRRKLQALRRRMATSRWSALSYAPASSTPPLGRSRRHSAAEHVPSAGTKAAAGLRRKAAARERRKHAEGSAAGRTGRTLVLALLPVIVAAVAGMWWLSAGAQPPWPGTAAAGWPPASAPPTGAVVHGGTGTAAPVDDARQRARAADPAVAVQGLASLRDYAFSSGRLELLDDVNVPGSAAAAADERIAAPLRSAGHRLAGFASTLSGVAAEEGATPDLAVVRVVSATSGFRRVDAGNTVLAAGVPSQPQALRLVLVSKDGQWRVSDVLAVP
ncbi:serine/threonine protein kinase [Pseudarthrobacter defluvii]|uniref:serine/threonine-protein kinase n=1 Tax=Pseudarthrobacter defluvii TaxID=410837 RepID=UPI0027895BAA|nr:serine/threonine-protein kinase [Pseudarthrobacter defluvii]MDQ0769669.1 serine/threonine protein kinase [Pseudarthrobacter defluvii]